MLQKHDIFDHCTKAYQLIGELGGFEVSNENNISVITGYPSAMFNYLNLNTKDEPTVLHLKERKIPFVCLPSHNFEHDFESYVQTHGLVKADFVTANTYDNLDKFAYTAPDNIKIHQVLNEDDLSKFDKISSIAFQHPEGYAFTTLQNTISHQDFYLFLASIDNNAVACGMVYFANNQAGLYWGGVLPEYRKQGVGTALTKYRMNFIKNKGFKSVCAQNYTPSLSYFQKIGFKSVGGLPLYMFVG